MRSEVIRVPKNVGKANCSLQTLDIFSFISQVLCNTLNALKETFILLCLYCYDPAKGKLWRKMKNVIHPFSALENRQKQRICSLFTGFRVG